MKKKILLPFLLLFTLLSSCQIEDISSDATDDLSNSEMETEKYTIIWKNDDGTIIETDDDVLEGTIPNYNGETPIKEDDDQHIYDFIGWSPTIVAASENATYTAVFREFKKGGIFEHGSYPQTSVSDQSLITTLNDNSGPLPTEDDSQSWTSYNYYFPKLNSTNCMWYQDISIDEDLYRGVYFTAYRPVLTTQSFSIDEAYQDDNGYYINTRYWFKFEPIVWDVLSVNEVEGPLLLSSKVIDSQEYYHSSSIRAIGGQTVYANNYQESNIRTWLNNSFLNTAFSVIEQNLIKTTNVDNSAESTGFLTNQYATTNTNDKLFLPSYHEITNADYGFSTNQSPDVSRHRTSTDYAQAMGVYFDSSSKTSPWSLRSPIDSYDSLIGVVYDDGYNRGSTFINITSSGILPAFRINR